MPAPPKDLLMVRLATVTFTPPPKGWREWVLRTGPVEVSPISAYEGDTSLKLLVGAGRVLDYRPKVSASNEVIVPEKQRNEAEEAIETAANLIALAQGCRRTVSSPTPAVVFVATGDDGRAWLAKRAGLQEGAPISGMRAGDRMDLDDSVLMDLNGRSDGVALMVEALAQDHALGRFRDFIRVFERAFARPAKKLTKPVVAFLDPRLGYTEAEVSRCGSSSTGTQPPTRMRVTTSH
jgi:hypothetical protein